MEVTPKFCFQDGKPVDVSSISSLIISDAKAALKAARLARKQIKATFTQNRDSARLERETALNYPERNCSKKFLHQVYSAIMTVYRSRRDAGLAYFADIITQLKTRIASFKKPATQAQFAPAEVEYPVSMPTTFAKTPYDGIAHIMNIYRCPVANRCKADTWCSQLNKSKCGQYWTSVNNGDMTNFILLDKHGKVIKDATTFNPYYLISTTPCEAHVYITQPNKFRNHKTLTFDKSGVNPAPRQIVRARFAYIGSGAQMQQCLEQNADIYGAQLSSAYSDKTWLPALLRFCGDVYKY